MIRIESKYIQEYIFCIFKQAGLNSICSQISSEALVKASLRGVDSHGVYLLPHYIKGIEGGRINRKPRFKFDQRTISVGILDADHSIGFSAGSKAIDYCVKMAKECGVAVVSVKNSTHGGMMAYYSLKAAREGFFSISMANTSPRLIPPNGKKPFLGKNPICYAVPVKNKEPLCYDGSTTHLTGNSVKLYKELNLQLPKNVAADKDGNPTTDPHKAKNFYAFGGYKGFGIAMMVDILCGALSGMPNSENVSSMYEGDISNKRYLGQFFIVLDISVFRSLENFTKELQQEIDRLRKMSGTGSLILAPGDPEIENEKDRVVNGIPLNRNLFSQLEKLGEKFGVGRLKTVM